jgi:hypothetical protein
LPGSGLSAGGSKGTNLYQGGVEPSRQAKVIAISANKGGEVNEMKKKNREDIEEYSDEWCEQAFIEWRGLEIKRELSREAKREIYIIYSLIIISLLGILIIPGIILLALSSGNIRIGYVLIWLSIIVLLIIRLKILFNNINHI